jgi:hypothetical protein
MDHPRPWLRYVGAGDLDTKTFAFDGLEVDSTTGDKLGKLEGFIIDVNSGRPYHVVVGSGAWFTHKHFLLPIGHVALDAGNKKLLADIAKDRVQRFPGFDKDEFEKLSASDLDRMDDALMSCCCSAGNVEARPASSSQWESAHYKYPTWWEADFYRPQRTDELGGTMNPSRQTAADRRR